MRFKGTPGMHVIDTDTGKTIGMFSDKGYLSVEDEAMVKRMKKRFAPAPVKQKKAVAPKGKEVK